MSFGTTIERRTPHHGPAAWLRILVLALLIALTVPALALADDAGAAVADPPAAQGEPAAESTPVEPPAAEQQPVDPAPAEPVPAAQPPAPAADGAPAEPPAATTPPPTPSAVTPPVEDVPVELPGIDLPAPPSSTGDPVPASSPTAAPELPEASPGAASPPVVALPPLTTTPAEPPALRLVAAAPAPVAPAPPTPGVADALGIPNSPPAVTIGPPQTPGFAALLAGLEKSGAAAGAGAAGSVPVIPTDLFSRASHGVGLAGSVTGGASDATRAVIELADRGEEPSFGLVAEVAVPVGPAPAGSSLLAVLAGYVLPGSSGPPASTLVMLIVIGLILGVGYAARPQLTEALASQRLLGASCGHGMAVRRPG